MDLLTTQLTRRILDVPGAENRLAEMARQIHERKLDPYTAVEELLASMPGNGDRMGT